MASTPKPKDPKIGFTLTPKRLELIERLAASAPPIPAYPSRAI